MILFRAGSEIKAVKNSGKQMPSVYLTIIIPTFNRYDDLSVCLGSISEQSGEEKHAEIFVIDDCSEKSISVKNRALCDKYHFNYIRNGRNYGSAYSRNTGIKSGSGEWMAFIDDDVKLNHDWLKNALHYLPVLPREVVAVEGFVKGSGGGLWDREVQNLDGHNCLSCNLIIRRDVLEKTGGFDSSFPGPFCEDHELAVRLQEYGEIIFNKNIGVTHLPRQISFPGYLLKSPLRMRMLLRSESRFYDKHPDKYHLFRHALNFQGTYRSILFKHVIINFRRRKPGRILRHPFQAALLLLSSIAEQLTAWILLPEMARSQKKSGAL